MLAERGYTLADIIGDASQAEKVFDPLFHSQLEAPDIPFPEGHLGCFFYRGQVLNVDLVL